MHAAFRARCLIQAGREAHADPALPLPTLTRATATSSKELFFSGRSTRRPATDTLAPAPTPASDLQPPSDRHASLDRGPRLVPLHRHAAMPLPAGDRLAGSTAPQARPSAYASPPANRKRARRAAMPPSAGDAAAHAHLRCLRRNSLKSWLQCVKIIKHTHGIRFAHTRVVCVNENCVLVFVSLKTHATTPQDALSFRTHLQGLRRVETRHAGLFPRTRHGLREQRMISGYPHMIDMCRCIPDI